MYTCFKGWLLILCLTKYFKNMLITRNRGRRYVYRFPSLFLLPPGGYSHTHPQYGLFTPAYSGFDHCFREGNVDLETFENWMQSDPMSATIYPCAWQGELEYCFSNILFINTMRVINWTITHQWAHQKVLLHAKWSLGIPSWKRPPIFPWNVPHWKTPWMDPCLTRLNHLDRW